MMDLSSFFPSSPTPSPPPPSFFWNYFFLNCCGGIGQNCTILAGYRGWETGSATRAPLGLLPVAIVSAAYNPRPKTSFMSTQRQLASRSEALFLNGVFAVFANRSLSSLADSCNSFCFGPNKIDCVCWSEGLWAGTCVIFFKKRWSAWLNMHPEEQQIRSREMIVAVWSSAMKILRRTFYSKFSEEQQAAGSY